MSVCSLAVFAVLAVFAGLGRAQSTFQGYLRVKYFLLLYIYYYGRQRRPFWGFLRCRCLNTLTNVFAINKRVYTVLRLNLKALQPLIYLTWGFPSDPKGYTVWGCAAVLANLYFAVPVRYVLEYSTVSPVKNMLLRQ